MSNHNLKWAFTPNAYALNTTNLSDEFSSVVGTWTIKNEYGRTGAYTLAAPTTGTPSVTVTLSAAQQSGIVAIAFRLSALNAIFRFSESGALHCSVRIDSDGSINLLRSDVTLLLKSPTGLVTTGNWMLLEIAWSISDSAGSLIARLNKVEVARVENSDTRNGGTGTVSMIQFQTYTNSWLEDIAVYGPGDWPGDIHVYPLPIAGPGANGDFTPVGAPTRRDAIDEPYPIATADYNELTASTGKDSYTVTPPSIGYAGVIHGITVRAGASTDVGSRNVRTFIREGGTETPGPTWGAGTTHSSPPAGLQAVGLNPRTGQPFTLAELAAAEIGYEGTA